MRQRVEMADSGTLPYINGVIMVIRNNSEKINRLKEQKKAVILAHNYQTMDIQSIADFVGDSLQLAQEAAKIQCELIVFCGVRFMAETAKLLNPSTKVLIPAMNAGCPMADMITGDQLRTYKAEHPDHQIVCYVNSTVSVKAESDICVTSSNAAKIVSQLPTDKPILFVPDKNLGQYVTKQTGRAMDYWDGFCSTHHFLITQADVKKMRDLYPEYKLIVHPECRPEIVALADWAGSTKMMADYVANNDYVIIGTEIGLYHQMHFRYPEKHLLPLSTRAICQNMKKTNLRNVLDVLKKETNEITIDATTAERALLPIKRMLELSK